MGAFANALEPGIFRPERALNAAVFDSMSVGLAQRIRSSKAAPDPDAIRSAYSSLLADRGYMEAVSRATADEQTVSTRMEKTIEGYRSA